MSRQYNKVEKRNKAIARIRRKKDVVNKLIASNKKGKPAKVAEKAAE